MEADVLGLQELHADYLGTSFGDAFSSTHALVHGTHVNWAGWLYLLAWRVLLGVGMLGVWVFLALAVAPAGLFWGLAALAPAVAVGGSYIWLHNGVVAVHFLSGSIHGGLALLVKRDALAVRAAYSKSFDHQSGDMLNLLRKRAYQVCLAEVLPQKKQKQQHQQQPQPRTAVLFIHTHANLGKGVNCEAFRAAQLLELVEAASSQRVAALLEEAGLSGVLAPEDIPVVLLGDFNAEFSAPSLQRTLGKGGFEDSWPNGAHTWDNKNNSLTNDVLFDPDGRVDLVLHRPAAALSAQGREGAAAAAAAAGRAGGATCLLSPLSAGLVLNEPPFCSDHFGVMTQFLCRAVPAGTSLLAKSRSSSQDSAGHSSSNPCFIMQEERQRSFSPPPSDPTTPRSPSPK